ncbi:SAM-dependent methyltransferase [Leucobacter sp. CSA2]|uniref:SAM-dependent methyltransferase n=1 Tax=Leucobacter edaphi TaxID=2796472 RepID=A0A934QCB2_9MICO|nr:SAM-dependent methyltransferase [Leucobacter edaphi]MBK0420534.1 SAM-dependent methyltransferase [Leucobacter edaphi]
MPADTREALIPMTATEGLESVLRAAGCVFAEEEAAILRGAAGGDLAELERLVAARVAGAPIEPLVGRVDFDGLRLRVASGVFVPRQRTIALARTAARELAARSEGPFVEAFAGVAPVSAWLRARDPDLEILVTERSAAALSCARANVAEPAEFHGGSVLAGLPRSVLGRIAVIAAVPPYVPDGDEMLLPREARDHEPREALFGGADGLDLVRALIDEARDALAPDGALCLEMSATQLPAAERFGRERGYVSTSASVAEDGTGTLVLALH